MNSDPILPIRLKASTPGLGHAAQADIERRAAELARLDGRDAYTDADLVAATAELGGSAPLSVAPEPDSALRPVTVWDDPPAETGRQVAPIPLDDEGAVAEQLIEQGIAEAEHDVRVAAAGQEDEEDL